MNRIGGINMKKIKEMCSFGIALIIVIAFLNISGIGCPIRFATGISCPGCGMSRACMSVLKLDFAKAFYYHPLFWLMPVVVVMYLFREKIPGVIQKSFTWIFILLFLGVYIYRMCFGDSDVVSINITRGFFYQNIKRLFF